MEAVCNRPGNHLTISNSLIFLLHNLNTNIHICFGDRTEILVRMSIYNCYQGIARGHEWTGPGNCCQVAENLRRDIQISTLV
jgi:hypothetical protein